MNKKQLVTVWVGVALIIFFVCWRLSVVCCQTQKVFPYIQLRLILADIVMDGSLPFIVAALAVGLTCTFADKKPKEEKQ